jgi:hypothetical protein
MCCSGRSDTVVRLIVASIAIGTVAVTKHCAEVTSAEAGRQRFVTTSAAAPEPWLQGGFDAVHVQAVQTRPAARPRTLKLAFYNIRSGIGIQPLGRRAAPFAETVNCDRKMGAVNAGFQRATCGRGSTMPGRSASRR